MDAAPFDCVIYKGHRQEEQISIGNLLRLQEKSDSLFRVGAGIFLLHEKYYTINQLKFLSTALSDPTKPQTEVNGH